MATKDPVCGMTIEESEAAATVRYGEQVYWFCSLACKARFEEHPDRYAD